MNESAAVSERARRRVSPVPPMPSPRSSLRVLDDLATTPYAYGFWRILSDLQLFVESEGNRELFAGDVVQDLPDPLSASAFVLRTVTDWAASSRAVGSRLCVCLGVGRDTGDVRDGTPVRRNGGAPGAAQCVESFHGGTALPTCCGTGSWHDVVSPCLSSRPPDGSGDRLRDRPSGLGQSRK